MPVFNNVWANLQITIEEVSHNRHLESDLHKQALPIRQQKKSSGDIAENRHLWTLR